MKIRAIGQWFLIFSCLGLLWSGSARESLAGQNYPNHVTVFGGQSAAPAPAPEPVDPAEKADIEQLMELAGAKATFTHMVNTMTKDMEPLLLHALPPGEYRAQLVQLFFEKFRANADAQHYLDMAVPIYAEYLSDEDIKGLIQFYKTPLGQKWINVQPKVRAGLLPASHAWGRELGRETMLEVLQEHPDLAQELKAAAEQAKHQQ